MTSITADRARVAKRLDALEDYEGCVVYEPEGERVGTVRELFRSADDGMEYLDVKAGLLGLQSVLVPVQAVVPDGERRLLAFRAGARVDLDLEA